MKVPKHIKERAQQEAKLAHAYGWIDTSTVTQLFIWVVDFYLATGIKKFIAERRHSEQDNKEETTDE